MQNLIGSLFLAVAVLLLGFPGGTAVLADEPITYQELANARSEYQGKTVRFTGLFSKTNPSVDPRLAARGITDKSHVAIDTPYRPLSEGGSLLLLAPKSNARLIEVIQALRPRQEVVFTGRVLSLTADSGALFYYVLLSGVEVPAPEENEDEGSGEPEEPPATGGSNGKKPDEYVAVEPGELAERAADLGDRKIRIVLPFGGAGRRAPAWAYRLGGLGPEDSIVVQGLPAFAVLVPRSNAAAVEQLEGAERGTRFAFSGTCRVEPYNRATRVLLLVEKVEPAGE
ncbi:MAG: hypothetical protein HY720_26880 [Planctomycetes bacterium]|nr:hypothetical protein [Planctomycetota bacterium]